MATGTVGSVHTWPAWDPLGVTPDGHGGARVALWSPGAARVDLCTFDVAGHETSELRRRATQRRAYGFAGSDPAG